jgi:hypothetical protein
VIAVATRPELVWAALPDTRSAAQRLADLEIEQESRDEPDPLERLRQDALAICSELFARAAERNNRPPEPCPGCTTRHLEAVDLTASAMLRVLEGTARTVRQDRRRRLRAVAADVQLVIAL